MKKIYFHIGAHKSASTTLQKNLIENKSLLLKGSGIHFLGRHDFDDLGFINHFKNLAGKVELQEEEYQASLEKAISSLEIVANGLEAKEIFISWEGILGHSSLDIYKGIYTHAEKIADSLSCLAKRFDIEVLLIARRQDEFIESCYLQQIKERRTISFDEFTDKININALSWLDVSLIFEKHLGEKFKAIPFELIKEVGAKKFIQFSLSVLTGRTISLDGFEIIEKVNPSYSQYGVEMARELLPKLSKESKIRVNKMLFNELGNDKFEKAVFFSKFNRSVLLKMLKKDNSIFFDKYVARHFKNNSVEIDKILKSWLGD